MVWGFCVYFVYMIPLETDVLRKHRFQKWQHYNRIIGVERRLGKVQKDRFKIFTIFTTIHRSFEQGCCL